MNLLTFLLIISAAFFGVLNAAETPCGDGWLRYKEDKCFKIVDDTLRNFDDAIKSCFLLESTSTLPVIHSKEEQDFLTEFLFKTQKKVENFWLGAKFTTNNEFKWLDSTDLNYTNWDPKGPHSKVQNCVQIQADESLVGKWIDEPCEQRKLTVCQHAQAWSLNRLQSSLVNALKKIEALEQKHADASSTETAIPIGFIYVQLPKEKSPVEIWSKMNWTDVSSSYEGVFFRVAGGHAESFGQVQEETSPKLESVELYAVDSGSGRKTLSKGTCASILTGTSGGNVHYSTKFCISGDEVRPRNMAIRVWKRTG